MERQQRRFWVHPTRFPNGERFALVYDRTTNLPHPWATRYTAVCRRLREESAATLQHDCRAIAGLLNWAHEAGIDLEARIESGALLTPQEILDLRASLRLSLERDDTADGDRTLPRTVGRHTHYTRIIRARDYVTWVAEAYIHRIPNASDRFLPSRARLQEFQDGMTRLLPKPKVNKREGIGPEAEARLREVIVPGHQDNPFQSVHQHRNHALILCHLDLGVRLSEALALKGHDLALHGGRSTLAVHRRPDDPDDPRRDKPNAKTRGRILPLGPELAKALDVWIKQHRTDPKRYPGAKRTAYVFVSRTGAPLSKRTTTEMFERLRGVEGLPNNVTSHLLRHDFNDRFSDYSDQAGLTEQEEKNQRNYLMGWSDNSRSSETYTQRSTRSAAQKASLQMQREMLDGTE